MSGEQTSRATSTMNADWQVATGPEPTPKISRRGTLYVGRRHAGRSVRFMVSTSEGAFRLEPCQAGDAGARIVTDAGLVSAGPVIAALRLPRGEDISLTVDPGGGDWPTYRVAGGQPADDDVQPPSPMGAQSSLHQPASR